MIIMSLSKNCVKAFLLIVREEIVKRRLCNMVMQHSVCHTEIGLISSSFKKRNEY